jgi:hypothetical protein
MQDKLLSEFERVGIKAMKTRSFSDLEKFIEDIGEKHE